MNTDPLRDFIRTMDDARFSLVPRTDAQKLEIVRNLSRAALQSPAHPTAAAPAHCQCSACKNGVIHASDCAVHNAPALPIGECDCGTAAPAQFGEPVAYFVNDNAPGLKPHYSQISEQFKDHKDVLAFYTAPQPSQPVEAGEPCSPFKCEAAQQDGVLCADDSCDIATGARSCASPQPVAQTERAQTGESTKMIADLEADNPYLGGAIGDPMDVPPYVK